MPATYLGPLRQPAEEVPAEEEGGGATHLSWGRSLGRGRCQGRRCQPLILGWTWEPRSDQRAEEEVPAWERRCRRRRWAEEVPAEEVPATYLGLPGGEVPATYLGPPLVSSFQTPFVEAGGGGEVRRLEAVGRCQPLILGSEVAERGPTTSHRLQVARCCGRCHPLILREELGAGERGEVAEGRTEGPGAAAGWPGAGRADRDEGQDGGLGPNDWGKGANEWAATARGSRGAAGRERTQVRSGRGGHWGGGDEGGSGREGAEGEVGPLSATQASGGEAEGVDERGVRGAERLLDRPRGGVNQGRGARVRGHGASVRILRQDALDPDARSAELLALGARLGLDDGHEVRAGGAVLCGR